MSKEITKSPVGRLKEIMSSPTVQEQFKNCLNDGSPLFVSSLIDLYGSDKYLQECEPKAVVMEALKAATLKLPINKSLGFAYVIAYKNKKANKYEPQFQIGYKGLIQLAMRTGQYRYINADKVYEGELLHHNKMTGELELGDPTSDKVVGYFAFIETINGFRKAIYWNLKQVTDHAKRFSMSYNSSYSPWKTDFDSMAIKTLLKTLLGKYGIMSIEMASAFASEPDDYVGDVQREIDGNANTRMIDIAPDDALDTEMTEEEKAEIAAQEAAEEEQMTGTDGPGY